MNTVCKNCGKQLSHEKCKNKFCSHSCSASYNNLGVRRNFKNGKWAKKRCLCCDQVTTNPKYCSSQCQQNYLWQERKKDIERNGFKNVGLKQIKRYILEINGRKCEICGITEWQGQDVPLVLDHIDGNSDNNKLENFRFVCG